MGSIARNFYLEDMNILYPRIDWRGDGPGYVESEFPLYPWLVACCYHVFGYHEEIARILSYVLSIATLIFFFKLAKLILPGNIAALALLVFALNPLAVDMASAIQPEPLMFFFSLVAIFYFYKWLNEENLIYYWASLLMTVLAILVKLPVIYIGLIFALLVIHKYGFKAVFRKDIILFLFLGLLIPFLWYYHAREIWIKFGNSLGISDEAYIRLDSISLLKGARSILIGMIKIETRYIWSPFGIILGFLGMIKIHKDKSNRILWYWLLALLIFFLGTGRTTGESWAYYYHIISVPLAALLIALGISNLNLDKIDVIPWLYLAISKLLLGISFLFLSKLISMSDRLNDISILMGMILILTSLIMIIQLTLKRKIHKQLKNTSESCSLRKHVFMSLQILCFAGVVIFNTYIISRDFYHTEKVSIYKCAKSFERLVPPGSLIAVNSFSRFDQFGLPRAFNAPYMFFWMNRKGFVVSAEDQNIPTLEKLIKRGAKYLVAEKAFIKKEFETEVRSNFRIKQECSDALLIELIEDKD